MPPQARRDVVLRFMAEYDIAHKPAMIYRNLRLRYNITFGEDTVKNILAELSDQGYIRRIDPESLADREIVDLDEGRGAYIITEKGRKRVSTRD